MCFAQNIPYLPAIVSLRPSDIDVDEWDYDLSNVLTQPSERDWLTPEERTRLELEVCLTQILCPRPLLLQIVNPPRKRVLKLEDMGTSDDAASSSRNVACWSSFLNYHADPAPEGATVNQLLSAVPSVFPPAPPSVPLCPRCGVRAFATTDVVQAKSVACSACGEVYHFVCADLRRAPKKPWICAGCR